MKFLPIVLLLASVLFVSCDPMQTWEYKVKNNSAGDLTLIFTVHEHAGVIRTDTAIIKKGEEGLISMEFGALGHADDKEKGDTMSHFLSMDAFLQDSLKSISDLRLRNRWKFDEAKGRQGAYKMMITDGDFLRN